MGQYLLKRLLLMIPTLIGITLITFLIIRLAPGDPVEARFGGGGMDATGEGGSEAADRAAMIRNAKVRLGLMRESGTVRQWDLLEEDKSFFIAHQKQVRTLRASPDRTRFATGGTDGEMGPVRVWNARGRLVATLVGPEHAVTAVAFSSDGAHLASVGQDRHLRLYDLEGATGEVKPRFDIVAHDLLVNAVAFSPDGHWLATGSNDKTVRVWEVATQRLAATLTLHYLEVTALVFLPDGKLISASRDRAIRLWDPTTWECVGEFPEARAEVLALALSPDGSKLAAGLGATAVPLWDVATRTLQTRLDGHTAAVQALEFAPDGHRLATASRDQTVRIWELTDPPTSLVLSGHSDGVSGVAFLGQGEQLVSCARDVTQVPLMVSYLQWMGRLVRLDFGESIKDGRKVRDKLWDAFQITLKLNLISILITYLLSIPLGVIAGARRNGVFDQGSSLVVFMLYSMPSFWVATMLIVVVNEMDLGLPYVGLNSPEAERLPFLSYVWDSILHMVLPMIALTYASFAFLSRLTRNNILEVLGQDYIRTARAKGLSEARVVGVHAFRNSLISIVTVVGNLLPALIGGSVIIEQIYNIEGMGFLAFNAILQRDYPVIMATTTLAAVLTMLGILLSDILYCLVDPRIQFK